MSLELDLLYSNLDTCSTLFCHSLRRALCGIHGAIWIDDLVEPRFESPIVKTSVSDEQPRHRTTVSKLLPMGLQLVCQRELYTPGLRYFTDGRQRSSLRIEWVDSSIGTRP